MYDAHPRDARAHRVPRESLLLRPETQELRDVAEGPAFTHEVDERHGALSLEEMLRREPEGIEVDTKLGERGRPLAPESRGRVLAKRELQMPKPIAEARLG